MNGPPQIGNSRVSLTSFVEDGPAVAEADIEGGESISTVRPG